MNDTKDKLVEDGDLSMERVERVGDYFKNLFVRSLKRGLDDGVSERPLDELPARADPSRTPVSIEVDSTASAGNDGESREKEAVLIWIKRAWRARP